MKDMRRGRQSFNAGRYGRVTYNYNTSAGPGPDFSKIGDQYVRNKEFQIAAQDKINARIQEQEDQLRDESEIILTGNRDADAAALDIQGQVRRTLADSKAKIDGKNYTLKDHNALYNKLMTTAKSYGQLNDFVEKEFTRVKEDKTLSGVVEEALSMHVGSVYNNNYKNAYVVGDDGNFIMGRIDESDGERKIQSFDMKAILTGSATDYKKFDPIANVKELQSIYADVVKTPEMDMEKIGNLDVFVTKHATKQTDQFNSFRDNTVKAFGENENKLVSYLYDHMGIGIGGDDDPNTLQLNADGTITVPEELRKKAMENYGTEIDAAFGVKTTASGQVIKKPTRSGGGGKAAKNQLFSSKGGEINPGKGDDPDQQFSINSIKRVAQLDAGNTMLSPEEDANFQANFPEFFDGSNNIKPFSQNPPSVEEFKAQADNGVDILAVDNIAVNFGEKWSKAETDALNIPSQGNNILTKINGFQMSYKWQYTETGNKLENGEPEMVMRKIPIGIHAVGPTTEMDTTKETGILPSEAAASGVSPLGQRVGDTKETSRQRRAHTTISGKLSTTQMNSVMGALEQTYPGVMQDYKEMKARFKGNELKAFEAVLRMDKHYTN